MHLTLHKIALHGLLIPALSAPWHLYVQYILREPFWSECTHLKNIITSKFQIMSYFSEDMVAIRMGKHI